MDVYEPGMVARLKAGQEMEPNLQRTHGDSGGGLLPMGATNDPVPFPTWVGVKISPAATDTASDRSNAQLGVADLHKDKMLQVHGQMESPVSTLDVGWYFHLAPLDFSLADKFS